MIKWSCLNMCRSAVGMFTRTHDMHKIASTPPIHTHTQLQGSAGRSQPVTLSLTPSSGESSWWERGQAIKPFPGSPRYSSILLSPPSLGLHIFSSSPLLRGAGGKSYRSYRDRIAEPKIITLQNSAPASTLLYTTSTEGEAIITYA